MKAFNAVITDANLTFNGVLMLHLGVKVAGGTLTSFGSHCLNSYKIEDDKENYAAWYLSNVFNVVGVESFNDLVGKPLRVIFDGEGNLGDLCIGIQNFLDYRKYFIPNTEKRTMVTDELLTV